MRKQIGCRGVHDLREHVALAINDLDWPESPALGNDVRRKREGIRDGQFDLKIRTYRYVIKAIGADGVDIDFSAREELLDLPDILEVVAERSERRVGGQRSTRAASNTHGDCEPAAIVSRFVHDRICVPVDEALDRADRLHLTGGLCRSRPGGLSFRLG